TDWVVVGNGRAEQVAPGQWELATTPPLSTYFVTLVAGPYHVVTAEHDGIALGLECRASLAPHLDKDAEEILTITGQCFDEFHRLFGVRYAFGDYHQAFVPEFNAGAMENPGCVTFRDPLVFTSKVTRFERTNRATTIAHEMAHQWFGDLVTMSWWDDLWLNESFAEYMGNRVTQDVTEFSDAWVDVAFVRKRWGVMADQRPSTHPVAGNGAMDAHAALQDFDGISYAKGSAVLKQLNARVGDEVFFAGVRDHFTRHRFGNATMFDLFSSWGSAGAGDLEEWTRGWLRTPGLDLLRLDRSGDAPVVTRTTPDRFPADRHHAISVARHEPSAGWVSEPVLVQGASVPVPAAAALPVVLDAAEETWARLALDDLTLAAMPDLLPRMTDPLLRASVWNAVRDAVRNALVDPEVALHLVEVALPHETQDVGVTAIGRFGTDTLAGHLIEDPGSALARVHTAARRRMQTATPGSGVQLAAVRTSITSSVDAGQLRGWLHGEQLPEGVVVDLDLQWKVLIRLATLGAVDRDELDAWLDRERTAQATVDHAHCLAALPDKAAKAYAWDRFSGAVAAPNYEVEAAGLGMWVPGQEKLAAPYVARYFAELPGLVEVHSGWQLADVARVFFPSLSVHRSTLEAAENVLADESLDLSLRRALVDEADDLRGYLRVRETFAR
ncbi:MAG TPA: aminopeptidase N, partial [Nocardioidaceae bacterium]|nr:aminopeptidase N [Nocardioidaceae bacterium]